MAYAPPYINAGLGKNPFSSALKGYQEMQVGQAELEEQLLANELSRILQPYAAQTAEENLENLYLGNELSKIDLPFAKQKAESESALRLAQVALAEEQAKYEKYSGDAGMFRYLMESGMLPAEFGGGQSVQSMQQPSMPAGYTGGQSNMPSLPGANQQVPYSQIPPLGQSSQQQQMTRAPAGAQSGGQQQNQWNDLVPAMVRKKLTGTAYTPSQEESAKTVGTSDRYMNEEYRKYMDSLGSEMKAAMEQNAKINRFHDLYQDAKYVGPGVFKGEMAPGDWNWKLMGMVSDLEKESELHMLSNDLTMNKAKMLPGHASDKDVRFLQGATMNPGIARGAEQSQYKMFQAYKDRSIENFDFADKFNRLYQDSYGNDKNLANKLWTSYIDNISLYGNITDDITKTTSPGVIESHRRKSAAFLDPDIVNLVGSGKDIQYAEVDKDGSVKIKIDNKWYDIEVNQ